MLPVFTVNMLTIFTFLGRLHPLVVHLPIGFLLLAVLFDALSYSRRYESLRHAVSFTLLAGFLAAVIACILGYMLSLTGDYDPAILSHHLISGIILAILSGLLFFSTTEKFKAVYRLPPGYFSVLLIGLVLLIGYTGHQGGNLTHGSEYLNLQLLTAQQRSHPARVEDALIFEDVIHPMLERKCGSCHEGGKRKGNLSMTDLKSILKGGKTGPAVIAGRPAESELYKRITLDPHQEKYMPSDGKPPLTKSEVTIIKWWIEKAMAAEGKKMNELKDYAAISPQVASFLGLNGAGGPGGASGSQTAASQIPNQTGTKTVPGEAPDQTSASDTAALVSAPSIPQYINPEIPQTSDPTLVDNLRKKGLMVRVMLQQPLMLDVTLPSGSGTKMAFIRDDLVRAGQHIIWLNLSGNGFTENDLGFLPSLPNVEKLRLEKNPISDGICDDVITLRHLQALNLNETKISSACLTRLEKNPSLKKIYSWKTAAQRE